MYNVAGSDYVSSLSHSVYSIEGLLFQHRIPVRFNEVHIVRSCEINPKLSHGEVSTQRLFVVNMKGVIIPFCNAPDASEHYRTG